jgi:pimeloyl-ACP methyl ester carboxylesterase
VYFHNQSKEEQMNRVAGVILLLVITSLVAAAAESGEIIDQKGEIEGAPYSIRIPAEWNGNLVMYAHGYKPRGAAWNPLHISIASVFLDRGFALAESGYSRQGWAVEEALAETEAVRLRFAELHGKPDSTFVTGHSMGGLITLATVETYPDAYDGALPMCGPLAPSLHFFRDYIFDMLVTFEALFGAGLPPESVPVIKAAALSAQEVEKALEIDPGMADIYSASRGVRRENLASIVATYHMIYTEFVDRAGGNPIDNRNKVYNDLIASVDMNAVVPRYEADANALEYLRRNYTPTGDPGRPVLALHTTYDAGVSPCIPDVYNTMRGTLEDGKWFVQMYAEADGHCKFTPDITGKAFDMLRIWAASGDRPEPGRLE